MVYVVGDAVVGGSRRGGTRATRPAKAGPATPLSVRLPGLTVVGPRDQRVPTNEGAINQTARSLGKRYFAADRVRRDGSQTSS